MRLTKNKQHPPLKNARFDSNGKGATRVTFVAR